MHWPAKGALRGSIQAIERRKRTIKSTGESNAAEPAVKKRTRWWVIVLLIVLIVVLGLCLWVLFGPAIVSVLSG